MKKLIFLSVFIFIACVSKAQSTSQALEQGKDVNVLYRNEGTVSFHLHTRGLGFGYRRGWHVTGKRKRQIEVEALNMKHPKEIREKTNLRDNAKSFYYGKLNSVFMLRAGFGYQNTLYRRADRKSVEIRCTYMVGPNITFAKPIYLTVLKEGPNQQQDYVIEQYDPDKHNLTNIVGRAPFINGFERLKVLPAAYAKLAFSFEYADYSNEVKAIETGIIGDFYPIALPMMARYPKENYIVTLYISFIFGKKWF